MLRVRRATADDSSLLFAWANDPGARANSASTDPISMETHETWLAAKLADPDAEIFVAADDKGPVGVVRFDVAGDEAEISVNVAPERRGEGLGLLIIRHGCSVLHRTREVTVVANIREENTASQKVFEAAGFEPDGRRVVRGVDMLRLIKKEN